MSDASEEVPSTEGRQPQLPTLHDAIDGLRQVLSKYPIDVAHFIADSALYGLAVDVVEHSIAAQLLAGSEVPRAAFVNARAAFESSMDLLYLTSTESEYDRLGCLCRIHELHEDDRLRGRMAGADILLGHVPTDARDIASIVIDDATEWDSLSPGKGAVLRAAFEEFVARKSGQRKNWFGMTREELGNAVALTLDPGGDLGSVFIALYSAVSGYSHPRMRTAQRNAVEGDDGGIVVTARESDKTMPGMLTAYACVAAIIALKRRKAFFGAV